MASVDILGRGLGPLVEDLLALGLIVVAAVLVADSTKRHRLDERAARHEVEDLPDGLGGPEGVAGVRLALGAALAALAALSGAFSDLVAESEEVDVGELEVGQVGEDVVGELEGLGLLGVEDKLAGGGDGGLIGGWDQLDKRRSLSFRRK